LLLVAVGALGVVDAAVESAYLAIPKKEESLASGCCTEAFDGSARLSRFLPQALVEEKYRRWLNISYYAINLSRR
jgi:hypothetical protein